MDPKAGGTVDEAQLDELTFEPIGEPELDRAAGLILARLRRREPPRTIR